MKTTWFAILCLLLALARPGWADTALTFNEVMYHPVTNETAFEWVELYNAFAVDLDISGWSITGGIEFTFPEGTIVPGDGFAVVALSPADLETGTGLSGVYGPFVGRLSNNGDELRLLDNSGRQRDGLEYGVDEPWPVGPDGSGVSLSKYDRDTASGPAGNWRHSMEMGGTPGADNFPHVGREPPDVPLVELGEAWKYDDTAMALDPSWKAVAYEDGTWPSHTSMVRKPVPDLFSTGVNSAGTVLAAGQPDTHYRIVAAAQGAIDRDALAILNHPNWLENDAVSSWIGILNPGATTVSQGNYWYRATFNVDGFFLDKLSVTLRVAADDVLSNVYINGQPLGITHSGFAQFSAPFLINSGFQAGLNTLEFRTVNGGTSANPHGFRAELTSSGLAVSGEAPLPAGPTTYYFRRAFELEEDPNYLVGTLEVLASDGAVVYLNGQEMLRLNMPVGPVSFDTPALTDLTSPGQSAPIVVPAGVLVSGMNLLAVEVHQAAGSGDGPLLGVDLSYAVQPPQPLGLAINEYSSATNDTFWIELANVGTNQIDLGGFVFARDGVTNQEHVLEGPILEPGDLLELTDAALGWKPELGDRLFLLNPAGRDQVVDGVVAKRRPRAREVDGTGRWLFADPLTPGAPNQFAIRDELVINEILFNAPLLPATDDLPLRPSTEGWVELHNRGGDPVDLTGWELDGGVRFQFAVGQSIPAGGYLVVAEDAVSLQALHPAAAIVGNLDGRLSGNHDEIVLVQPNGNPADEVHYYDREPWPDYADGGGSSLELRHPDLDNARAEAWAASDESARLPGWQDYSYRMVAENIAGPTQWNDFILGLLDNGECLIDDIHVVETPDTTPIELVANGNFENGITGWRPIGTHGGSRVIVDPENAANHVLRLVATGAQEHMHNHIETTHINHRTVVNGREYEIRYRAKWLAGNNLLNTRLYFNRVARSTRLPIHDRHGTPGAQNSRWTANPGPTYHSLQHQPVTPKPGQSVRVAVFAQDPNGVAAVSLRWSVNSGQWNTSVMVADSDGAFAGAIPGQAAGAVVQFYVEATDGLGANSSYPAEGPDSGALYAVADGQAKLDLAHNVRIILSPANTALLHAFTNVQSNARIPGTVVYDERRAYYGVGVRLKGSERGRYSNIRVSFHLTFPPDDPYRGVHPVMLVDRSGAGDSEIDKQKEILIKHILLHAGNIPGTQADICHLIAPQSIHTGPAQWYPRHEDEYVETAFENGGDGQMFELELIYYPTTTNAFGYKNPNPDQVTGVDISDLGDDPETYRYNFILKGQRAVDDYSRFVTFAKTLSLQPEPLQTQANQVMDVDQWMRAWAMVTLCGVGDSYTFGNNHNLLMYIRPSDRRFLAFPWDMDFSFTRSATDPLIGNENLSRVIMLTPYLRLFYGHIKDIISTTYNTAYMSRWIDHYDNFAPGQNYSEVVAYINTRASFALGVINGAGGNLPFDVTSTNHVVTSRNLVMLTGTAPVDAATIRINGLEFPLTWSTLGQWRISVPVSGASNVLEVAAYDVHGRPLTSMTESIIVEYSGLDPEPEDFVVINEIMYHPVSPHAAFVELHNRSSDYSFELSGWRLDGVDYMFPAGSILTNGHHLVLAEDFSGYLAAYGSGAPKAFGQFDGTLRPEGEILTLLIPGTNGAPDRVIDQVRYENVAPWIATADGSGTSLQLVDPAQDNSRVSNWGDGFGWRFYSASGAVGFSANRIILALAQAGDLYVDNIRLVPGTDPFGPGNVIVNGDFESGTLNNWVGALNHSNSVVTSEVSLSGNYSLQIIADGPGSTGDNVSQAFGFTIPSTSVYTLSFNYLPVGPNRLKYRAGSGISDFNIGIDVTPMPVSPGQANAGAGILPPYDPIWLNEVAAQNVTGRTDSAGDRDPWVELFNAGIGPASLDGYYLAGTYDGNLTQWPFPAGTMIDPGEFKLVWLDGELGEAIGGELHASFNLPATNGTLALTRLVEGQPQITDYLTYQGVGADQSYGDLPDGQPFNRVVFLVRTPDSSNVAPPFTVYINEWLASNVDNLSDPAGGGFEDWFELYNPGPEPADLTGFYLSDNLADKTQFQIPGGFVIPPNSFLLVWADNDPEQSNPVAGQLHVNFALSRNGESLGLYSPEGITIDAVSFGFQEDDVSQGRFPDGTATLSSMPIPTPGLPNRIDGGIEPTDVMIVVDGEIVHLSFAAAPGRIYQAYYAESLEPPIQWLPLGTPQMAQGNELMVMDNVSGISQRFYQVQDLTP